MGSFWGGVSWGLPGASWGFSGASILGRLGRCGWRSCPVVVVSGGCLRPVVVRLGGACVQQSWPGRALVSGRLFDGRCVGRPRGGMPLGGTLRGGGFLGAFWGSWGSWSFLGPPGGFLGLPGASWGHLGLLGLAGASSWGLLGSWELLGLLGVSWGLPAGSRRVSLCFLRHPGVVGSLWFVLVFSRRGFWWVLASSCRPFGGCLRPVVAWAGARVRSSFGRASRVGQSPPAMIKKVPPRTDPPTTSGGSVGQFANETGSLGQFANRLSKVVRECLCHRTRFGMMARRTSRCGCGCRLPQGVWSAGFVDSIFQKNRPPSPVQWGQNIS